MTQTGKTFPLTRRGLLRVVAGTGLCLAAGPAMSAEAAGDGATGFGVYLRIAPDGAISILTPNAEMGQGTFDGLAKVLVEELDADWARVTIGLSGANAAMANPKLRSQTTGNSEAVRGYYAILRKTGAAAREMLVAAAAQRWGVSAADCRTEAGVVTAGNRTLDYGALAADAAKLPVPIAPVLKDPASFRLLGKDMPRKETSAKVRGAAIYGIDVELPGMLVGALAMPDAAYGKFRAAGLDAARTAEGIKGVVPVLGGHAVVAGDWWTAQKAAALVSFEVDGATPASSADLDAMMRKTLADEAAPTALFLGVGGGTDLAASRQSAVRSLASASKRLAVDVSVPYLAHGTMEPMACTAQMADGRLTIWAPTQSPGTVSKLAAKLSGLAEDKVTVHRTFLGGGFGRRWNTDFAQQAIEAAIALPGPPIKLIWNRTQDGQHDFYRPAAKARIEAGLDAAGRLSVWKMRVTGQSIAQAIGRAPENLSPDGTLAKELPYVVPVQHVESAAVTLPVPIGFWRSVAHMPNIFYVETAMDELAVLAGADPLAFRLAHLDDPRSIAVLKTLARMMAWPQKPADGIGHGLALTNGYGSWCAVGARVRRQGKALTVERIWAAMDCGLALEPENVRRQAQGALAFGLGPALDGRVLFENGVASALNLGDIGALTPAGMPRIEVELVRGGDEPGGVGEVAVPGVAPAICNALVAAGGERVRDLPLSAAGIDVTV
ncbi:molybdopterin cofactor-binding domain-containing protein [Polymorphobacter sp.]|uniref:xanthine dehydrogenase family protein molybdopterin-binding subunit n=1 Tax=Polymorphobacter sp. TaxID=1909290 RepID=UPI003F72BD89